MDGPSKDDLILSGEIEAVKICLRKLIARSFASEDEAAIRRFFEEARQFVGGMDASQLPRGADAPAIQQVFETAHFELHVHERSVLRLARLTPPSPEQD